MKNIGGYITAPGPGTGGSASVSGAATVLLSGQVSSGFIGNNAVVSGSFASGQVSVFALANASVQSGTIASGSVARFHLASGAVNSGQLASGVVLGQAGGGAFNIASGTISNLDIGSGAITSGLISSGQVSTNHLASGSVQRFQLGSGSVNSGHLASGSIAGQAGGGVSVASGSLGTFDLASGSIISRCQEVSPIYSGASVKGVGIITSEAVSGVRAVQIDPNGNIRIAMAAVSGRMPACGVVYDNVASGIQCNVYTIGFAQYPNAGSGTTTDFSGAIGSRVWVGMSGHLLTTNGAMFAPLAQSGGWLSGSFAQTVGIVVNSGGVLLSVYPYCFSGSLSSGATTFLSPAGAL